jgi:hypothetical protein
MNNAGYLDKRWALRQKEIEIAIAGKEQAMKAELLRDERDQKLVADLTNTLLAKELQRSEELLENLAETQQRIVTYRKFCYLNFSFQRLYNQNCRSPSKTLGYIPFSLNPAIRSAP